YLRLFQQGVPPVVVGRVLGHRLEPRQELDDVPDFVRVDGVTHARIDPLGYASTKRAQHVTRFMHARQRNVPIDIAAAEERRRSAERARIAARRAGWPDQAGGKPRDRAVAPGIARRVFEREAAAL